MNLKRLLYLDISIALFRKLLAIQVIFILVILENLINLSSNLIASDVDILVDFMS